MPTIPVINVKTNPLDVLLAMVGYRLIQLSKGDNEQVLELLKQHNLILQVGCDNANVSRYFRFENGEVSQHLGKADNPDLDINFQSTSVGLKLLTQSSVVVFMSAIQHGKVKLSGDYTQLMWFHQLAKYIVPEVPEQLEPFVEKAKPHLQKAQNVAVKLFDKVQEKMEK